MAMSPSGLFEMNDTHIEEFYRDGYFVAPRLIDRETVESIIDDFESQGETVDPAGEWKATGFTHFSSHAETYPRVAQFLQSERLVDMMERLFRSPARLWLGMYAVVRPQGAGGWLGIRTISIPIYWGRHSTPLLRWIPSPKKMPGFGLHPDLTFWAGSPISTREKVIAAQPIRETDSPVRRWHPATRYFFTGRPYIGAVKTAQKNVRRAFAFQVAATRATMPRAESRL